MVSLTVMSIFVMYKVVIPRRNGTELRYTLEVRNVGNGRTEGRTDGTYSAGVKDSASAYVLCPRLTEQLCLSIWKGVGNTERNLERFQER